MKCIEGSVISRDGTSIGYQRWGQGPALVVCHGAFTQASDWATFARQLAASHTVYLYDRRGRGSSPYGDAPYSLDAELDDLAAMVELAGAGTAVLGHSFGGGCALMQALRDGFDGTLVLYEPINSLPRPATGEHYPRLQALVAQGELEAATVHALKHVVRMPAAQVEQMKHIPLWPAMVATVPAFVNEAAALDTIKPSVTDARQLKARPFLLVGEISEHDPCLTCAAALVDRLRGLTLYTLPRQGHAAYLTDPVLLARVVTRCLNAE
ncbi:alpha/beta fold hydrolase [Pseudomonas sp. RIT-To-2]|uniref:alpha/beta fold hydrolase n=1 Tax=Pseudomonas sp. RIT-To-2 TaxID=3462541 RepID=UPI0024139D22